MAQFLTRDSMKLMFSLPMTTVSYVDPFKSAALQQINPLIQTHLNQVSKLLRAKNPPLFGILNQAWQMSCL